MIQALTGAFMNLQNSHGPQGCGTMSSCKEAAAIALITVSSACSPRPHLSSFPASCSLIIPEVGVEVHAEVRLS